MDIKKKKGKAGISSPYIYGQGTGIFFLHPKLSDLIMKAH